MRIIQPVRDGLVADWDTYEELWLHALKTHVQADTSETAILLAEKAYVPQETRHKNVEVMFEKFQVPSLFLSKDAVLACYACGRSSGLVCDFGGSGSTITPVHDGWIDTKGLNRCAVGGTFMDSHILEMLHKWKPNKPPLPLFRLQKEFSPNGGSIISCTPKDEKLFKNCHPTYHAFMNLQMAREMKQTISRVADTALTESTTAQLRDCTPLHQYELPDGTMIDVGLERFACGELYFDSDPLNWNSKVLGSLRLGIDDLPKRISSSNDNFAKLVADSFYRCDGDVQQHLLTNIVVTGGGATLDDLPERLRLEVESIIKVAAPAVDVKTISCSPNERSLCPWLGGSILGSLSSFKEIAVSKKDYQEYGPSIVDKKCP
eukprot:GSChrysophyteH1.ASY1.ANO1.1354.1 assembled CDS